MGRAEFIIYPFDSEPLHVSNKAVLPSREAQPHYQDFLIVKCWVLERGKPCLINNMAPI